MENEFRATYNLFVETFINMDVTFPMSYEVWQSIPMDLQAAALFCNFYSQINLVWNKVKTPASVSADCVSEVLMYLQKNVKKILCDPKRYTQAYIYRVSYNCMFYVANYPYTKTTGVNGYYQNTTPHIVQTESGEVDLYDTYVDNNSELNVIEKLYEYEDLWERIDSLDDHSKLVVYGLMDGKKNIGIPKKEKEKILSELRVLFKDFVD